MDQIQHTNGGQRFKLLPGGELPMRQYASHYADLHRTHPPKKPFAYRCVCSGQMPAIGVDKHDCLLSILTMYELKKAAEGSLRWANSGRGSPCSPLALGPWSVCKNLLPFCYHLTTKKKPRIVELMRHTEADRRSNNINKDRFYF